MTRDFKKTAGVMTPDSDATSDASFATDVRAGLARKGQKTLPSKYLYDDLGSALFEAITQLPEYGLWRAESRIFSSHAADIARAADASTVIELGSGSANKTVHLLKALMQHRALSYWGVDVSAAALAATRRELESLPGLRVRGVRNTYIAGLKTAMTERPQGGRTLVLFLGSSLGNFDYLSSLRFLQQVRGALRPGDALLLGADLLKPEAQLIPAYDDALGVTAAFNLNLLVRMNRELGADFVLPQYRHRAFFNAETHDVEMHIESLCDQEVTFPEIAFTASFKAGETIHTECSHKYSLEELEKLTTQSGFRSTAHWLEADRQFVSGLYSAV